MNHEQQLQFRQQLQNYIINSKIYPIFESLIQDLMISKPSNPIDFMIGKLQQPERQFNFVIGPPGLRVFSFLEKVRQEMDSKEFNVFNCGEFIKQISNTLSHQTKQSIQNGLLVNKQEISEKLLTKIRQMFKNSTKSIIIQGYPKSLEQAIDLQQSKIFPTKIILMNVNDVHLRQICEFKITSNYPSIPIEELQNKVTYMVIEYKNNLKQLKEFYNNFSEIDLSINSSEEYIMQELRRAFEIKTISLTPRTCSHVLIIGAPNSGRTSLAKSFAKYYNLVYVSTKALISNQIRKDSITGRKIKEQFMANELIDQFTIQKLIEERVSKTDCLMQGFVLEGYPKTKEQYENIKQLNLKPTLTVVIDLDSQESIKRGKEDLHSGKKRFEKWMNLRAYLEQTKDKMFWVNPYLNQQNIFQEVKYEFEKQH